MRLVLAALALDFGIALFINKDLLSFLFSANQLMSDQYGLTNLFDAESRFKQSLSGDIKTAAAKTPK